jgi:hypothetical protein
VQPPFPETNGGQHNREAVDQTGHGLATARGQASGSSLLEGFTASPPKMLIDMEAVTTVTK